jgi:hypothetical protein
MIGHNRKGRGRTTKTIGTLADTKSKQLIEIKYKTEILFIEYCHFKANRVLQLFRRKLLRNIRL